MNLKISTFLCCLILCISCSQKQDAKNYLIELDAFERLSKLKSLPKLLILESQKIIKKDISKMLSTFGEAI